MTRSRRPAVASETLELDIEKLGTEGAGLARLDGRSVLVPDALPGERVRVRLDGDAVTLLERCKDAPDRIAPPCRHFGTCGGCVLQHLAPSPYAAFKATLIQGALSRHGLGGTPIAAVAVSPPHSRRRAVLAARRIGAGVVLGFRGRASHHIVDLAQCPVLLPALDALLPKLRALAADILAPGQQATLMLTAADTGVDLGLGLPVEPKLAVLQGLADFAEHHSLARLWWRVGGGEPVPAAQRRPVQIRFGAIAVDLPPGGFLQATAAGEAALFAAAQEWLGGARRIADLFAGIGTFALGLADGANRPVHAVEQDAAARAALAAAARRAGLVRVSSECRDLEARPLLAPEFAGFDAVLFDPPRAGARAQAEQLAQSRVTSIIGVSCNPASFARDAAILVAGGYTLDCIRPIDQFLWSNQIELIGRFRRPGPG
jgi:23S rRNA (uracil1939-C5)-methyltransferase